MKIWQKSWIYEEVKMENERKSEVMDSWESESE